MMLTYSPTRHPASACGGAPDLLMATRPGNPTIVEIAGELDIASAPGLRESLLRTLQEHGPAICVDLRGVTFLDCSGVNVLLATARRAWLEGGSLRVVRPSPQAWRVIVLLGLQDVLASDALALEMQAATGHQPARSVRCC